MMWVEVGIKCRTRWVEVSLFQLAATCLPEIVSYCLLFLSIATSSGFLVRESSSNKMYLDRIFELLYGIVFFVHYFFEFLIFADLLELFFLGIFLLDFILIFLPLHKGLYLAMRHLQNAFNDVWGCSYNVFNVVLADLII